MSSRTRKQKKFMDIVAHSPEFAEKVGVPQSVGKEFVKEDKKLAEENKKKAHADYLKRKAKLEN